MTKLKFIFDIGKDTLNLWETANSSLTYGTDFSSRIPKELLEKIKNKPYPESKKHIIKFNEYIYKSKIRKEIPKLISQIWNKIDKKFFAKLNKITKKKFKEKEIKVYFTTAPRCPYHPDKNDFYVNVYSNIPTIIGTICHELMHFHFHDYYFNSIQNKIGREKTHEIKEALTVLLNIEFKDIISFPDKGYPVHQELRKFIANQWKKDKNFDKLLNKCVELVNKNSKMQKFI